MTGIKSVHQCLFCPQTFSNASEKDDHILEHFAQETCADCDQKLIQIGSNLYTLHNAVTCIKRELKPKRTLQCGNREEHRSQNEITASIMHSTMDCDRQIIIKMEPEAPDELATCVVPINFVEITDTKNTEESINQDCDENNFDVDITPLNTVLNEKTKIEPIDAYEHFLCANTNIFLETNDMDVNQSRSIVSKKMDAAKTQKNYRHVCDVCGKQFMQKSRLKQHIRLRHSGTKPTYECDICKKVVHQKDSIRRHMQNKHDPDRIIFKCDVCKAVFLCEKPLDSHLPRCKGPKKQLLKSAWNSSQCVDKGRNVVGGLKYKIPRSIVSKELIATTTPTKYRYTCDVCGEGFKVFCRLEQHKQYRHSEINHKYECDICKKVVHRKDSIRRHMQMKHDPNRIIFKCELCKAAFLSEKSLDSHLPRCKHLNRIEVNKKFNAKNFYCEICDKIYTNRSKFRQHNANIHCINAHRCTKCKKVFLTFVSLINHSHRCNNVIFECCICHKLFKRIHNLRFHIRSLHVINCQRIQCELCDKSFKHKRDYQNHMNIIHMDIRTSMCCTCGQVFTNRSNLQRHEINVHGEVKPTKCPYEGCNKYYKNMASMSTHLKSHKGLKQYQCKIDGCNEQFGGKVGFKKHKLNVHGIQKTKVVKLVQ